MVYKKDYQFNKCRLFNFVSLDKIDAEQVRIWRNHVEVRKWMYQYHKISRKEHHEFLGKLKADNRNLYWLLKQDGEQVGVFSLNKIDLRNKNAYLGIYANPLLKIDGAGALLIQAIKYLAFKVMRLHSLKLEVLETNKKVISFYQRSGFVAEGKLKEFVRRDNQYIDVIIMGVVNKE